MVMERNIMGTVMEKNMTMDTAILTEMDITMISMDQVILMGTVTTTTNMERVIVTKMAIIITRMIPRAVIINQEKNQIAE